MEENRFSEADLAGIRAYEQQTGKKIIYTFEEKCEIYRTHPQRALENASRGISRSLWARLSLDNADSFDNPDDDWKTKVLEENLRAIQKVLAERK